MRRALATVTIAGAVALVPFTAATASASTLAAGPAVAQSQTDQDEPLAQDGNDDTGKYGLIGLTGLFGLFGYKKYRDSRGARATAGTSSANSTDGTSRRV